MSNDSAPPVPPVPPVPPAPTTASEAPADHSGEQPATTTVLDLDAIEQDLADVEAALTRLDGGDYWRDEVTGAALPDDLLASQPTARRVGVQPD
jgi:RNA polymerase-binding transcription factor DksA